MADQPTLVLVKHAQPILEASVPPREWVLGAAGERESYALAERLRAFLPATLVTSPEPKALATAAIVARELGVPYEIITGLEEIDRRASPILAPDEHQRVNQMLFISRSQAVVGRESADEALVRFERAIASLAGSPAGKNLIAITHGTVISLFVERRTGRSAFDTWRSLGCAAFVCLPRW